MRGEQCGGRSAARREVLRIKDSVKNRVKIRQNLAKKMLKLTNIPTVIKVLVKEPGKNSKSLCVSSVAGAALRRGPRAHPGPVVQCRARESGGRTRPRARLIRGASESRRATTLIRAPPRRESEERSAAGTPAVHALESPAT